MGGAGGLRAREGWGRGGLWGPGPQPGEDPLALNSRPHRPQVSWRSEHRSRTTVRSAALPNLPTPTAWWPSEGQRTSTGAAGAPVLAACGWVACRGAGSRGRRQREGSGPVPPRACSYSVFEGELSETIPVVHASIAGCRIIGRMCVGKPCGRRRGREWSLPAPLITPQEGTRGGPGISRLSSTFIESMTPGPNAVCVRRLGTITGYSNNK